MPTPSSAGKGDDPRPLSVSYEEYSANWDLAFRKKEQPPVKRKLVLAPRYADAAKHADLMGWGSYGGWFYPGGDPNYLRGLRNVEIIKLDGWEQGKSAEFLLVLNALESRLAAEGESR